MKHNLSNEEKIHADLMLDITDSLSSLPMALKGGTALLFGYGLDRFSEDLDFDSNIKLNIVSKIRKILEKNTKNYDLRIVKDSDTVQRLRINYLKDGLERSLKIEISFRSSFEEGDICYKEIDAKKIKTYKIQNLISQKINALINRTKARDLYDVNFLLNQYLADFNQDDRLKLYDYVKNIDNLEGEYKEAFKDDFLLNEELLDSIILNIEEKRYTLQK